MLGVSLIQTLKLLLRNPSLYSPSNYGNQQMQQSAQNLTVANTEDIVTSSQKPKKGKLNARLHVCYLDP